MTTPPAPPPVRRALRPDPKGRKVFVFDAAVLRWLDGDSLEVRVDLGFKVKVDVLLRLLGASARDLKGADPAAAQAALDLSLALAPVDSRVVVETHYSRSFERYVARVFAGGKDVAAELVAAGLAVPTARVD